MNPLLAAFETSYFLDQLRPDSALWNAVGLTVGISVVAQLAGTLLGLVLATSAMSRRRILRTLSGLYVWIFRGTPVLLQIVFWYLGSNLLFGFEIIPRDLDLGIAIISGNVLAGVIALSLNEAAYMSEIIRAGVLAVDDGQLEAGLVVGMTEGEAMRRIVLPQAARLIVPGLGNEFNNMLKTSSLVSVIGVTELYQNGQVALSQGFKYAEVFAAVACWYLALTTIWLLIQVQIERRLGRSDRKAGERFFERLFGVGGARRTYS
ncbi:MAG: putative polar amino acid transporter, permease protein [Thermoleophilia bacterium]|nr:putative polar amino acid transporter, permease protein [Thermoleophilia bacterium]